MRQEADAMMREDEAANLAMSEYGASVIPDGANVLTHCNTGALVSSALGTALGAIRAAHESGKRVHVWVDETRPLLQGARLTAWELQQLGIPCTLITDNMAGHFMALGEVDLAMVGADRIAANGDTANKIGTYSVAVLARAHDLPFYVVAPTTTVDLSLAGGESIVIEERKPEEVTSFGGIPVAPVGTRVANPAFDVTPARLIAGIMTEAGIARFPFASDLARYARGTPAPAGAAPS
jgi:methylthioribose-1-phosphate isomerase